MLHFFVTYFIIFAFTLIFYSLRQSNAACWSIVQFDLQPCRQVKPKSNTKVFGLGFSFAKIQVLSAFFGCRCAVVLVFSGFVLVCSYRFICSICRRFYAAKAKKREWVKIGFAWFFWRFQGVKSYSGRSEKWFLR